jgi:hypothetical protein
MSVEKNGGWKNESVWRHVLKQILYLTKAAGPVIISLT